MHFLAQQCVKSAERLVHKQRVNVARQRASNCQALLHAAGELRGVTLGEILQPHTLQRFKRSFLALACGRFLNAKPQLSICIHRFPGKKAKILQDKRGSLARFLNVRVIDQHAPAVRTDKSCSQPQHARFPAAGWSDNRKRLSAFDPQV